MRARLSSRAAIALGVAFTAACSSPYEGETATLPVPGPAAFDSVAVTLDSHCGSLDCHGKPGRNFRLYGYSGRRLDPRDVPGGAATTPRESGVDYCSAIGLEPELLAQVLADHGARPERLSFIRKARGSEKHVGGTVFDAGSDGDSCLVAWVSGKLADDGSGNSQTYLCSNSLPTDPANKPPSPSVAGLVNLSGCGSATAQP
ncbi:MAG TPA: hypothetical protein VF395_06990 [Polyangiaceae bacterium]